MMRCRIVLLMLGWAMTLLPALADNNLQYTLTRSRQLHERREFAASAKLLDRYIDNMSGNIARNDTTDVIDLLRLQGDNFYNLGVTSRAADLYEQALKLAKATGNKRRAASISNELFIIHFNSGNTALSQDLLTQSLDLYRTLNDTNGVCKILNNIGIFYYKTGDLDKSLRYYHEALNLSTKDSTLSSTLLPTIYTNLAETLSMRGEYASALHYLDEAIRLTGGGFSSQTALQAWLNKAGIKIHLGNRQEARDIISKVGYNFTSEDPYLVADSYSQIAALCLELGDSLQGLRWNLKATELSDSLRTKEENEQLRQILVRYNSERIADHNKILELDVKRQRMINYVMISLIVLVLAFSAFLIHKNRMDRRKNKLIREQKEQLMEFERMEHDRKEKEFIEQLDHKNRQLTSYSIDAASISELHKIIVDSLKKMLTGATPSSRSEINNNIALLQNFNRTEVNEDFRVYFNEVHPDLLKKISEKYPALTPNDLRLCSYLYLGMSTKEIAALTFREIRSIESSRLRLRKKLGISGDQTLHDFLHNI